MVLPSGTYLDGVGWEVDGIAPVAVEVELVQGPLTIRLVQRPLQISSVDLGLVELWVQTSLASLARLQLHLGLEQLHFFLALGVEAGGGRRSGREGLEREEALGVLAIGSLDGGVDGLFTGIVESDVRRLCFSSDSETSPSSP